MVRFLHAVLGAGMALTGCSADSETVPATPAQPWDGGPAQETGMGTDALSVGDGGAVSDTVAPTDAGAANDTGAASDGDAARVDGSTSDTGLPSDAGADLGSPPDGPPAMRCNGHEALCDRRFDQVVFPTTHNAMSNSDDGWLIPNQTHAMARQLEDGIRAMLIDTYPNLGTTYLCHSSCLLGSKRLADGLHEIAEFLRKNPNEVMALVIEDHISAADTEKAFVESGLAEFVYAHTAGSPFPTLRDMIASGRRVFVGAEMSGPPPSWYHHFYDLAWDTPYTFRSTNEFSCDQNRGSRSSALFLLNHWVENPTASEPLSQTANARDVLLGRARRCQMESGSLPNFVAVNHYSVGDLFEVVRTLNGI